MDRPRKHIGKRFWKAYSALYGEATQEAPNPKKRRSGARIKPSCPTEHQEQVALCKWAQAKRLPLVAVPNAGRRTVWEGARQKAAGLSPGFPDAMLLLPRKGFGGMFVELKRVKGGVVSAEQTKWLNWLNHNGYHAVVAYGCEDAIRQLQIYLALPIA